MKILLIATLLLVSGGSLVPMLNNARFAQYAGADPETTPTPNKVNIDCDCSKVRITTDFRVIKAGDIAEFRIDSDNPEFLKRSFDWTISAGTIITGQGTSRISVLTTEEMLKTTPTPTPSPDPFGFVYGSRPKRIGLKVVATLSDQGSCSCPPAELLVSVGHQQVPENLPANVEELNLDETKITLPCPRGALSKSGNIATDPIISVDVAAKDPENDVMTYHYTVSGGKIIGVGAKVKWDLSDVVPGQYTITAGVDDGCGICGKTKTKEVTVVNTQDCIGPDISCPDLKLLGPDKISGPGVYTVTANISGASSDNEVSYLWTVTNGSIVDGYGTPSIQVRIPRDIKGIDPVVTLQVQGAADPRGMCLDKVSITLPVKPR